MAEKTKRSIKQYVEDKKIKTKAYVSKKKQQVKDYGRKYKNDIRTAYDVGFARGWDDAYHIPKRFGAKTVAAYAYKKGMKARRTTDKNQAQYRRWGDKK